MMQFKQKVDTWIEISNERYNELTNEGQKMKEQDQEFKVNNIKAEMDMLQRVFSEQKLQMMEETFGNVVRLGNKLEYLENR